MPAVQRYTRVYICVARQKSIYCWPPPLISYSIAPNLYQIPLDVFVYRYMFEYFMRIYCLTSNLLVLAHRIFALAVYTLMTISLYIYILHTVQCIPNFDFGLSFRAVFGLSGGDVHILA